MIIMAVSQKEFVQSKVFSANIFHLTRDASRENYMQQLFKNMSREKKGEREKNVLR
jgi:hypothetical protein